MWRGVFLCLFFWVTDLSAETTSPLKVVYLLTYEGIISPVASELFVEGIHQAETAGAEALIIQLDTPGGLDTAMRDIVKAIMASNIPVIVHVFPSGSRAASAGAFITLAAHLAAMTPGTNIGAAHPVALGGGKMDDETKKKAENDAAAFIRTLAEQRGRNVEWAEDAVRKSVSATENEAVQLKIIDMISPHLTDLLQQINGRTVQMPNKTVVLDTAGAQIITIKTGFRHQILKMISDPNVAYILMALGTTGLIAELYSPGLIFPGVLGSISLILAFYAFQTMPVNYAGVALILLSVVLFIAETIVTGFGLLALGGVTSLLIGSLMLFDPSLPFQISPNVLFATIGTVALMSALWVGLAWRAQRSPLLMSGGTANGLWDQRGIVQSDVAPRGTVRIQGELWQAQSEEPLCAGEEVAVIQRIGLTLHVKKWKNPKMEGV